MPMYAGGKVSFSSNLHNILKNVSFYTSNTSVSNFAKCDILYL